MPQLLKKDDRLGEGVNLQRWIVLRKIGDGGFAEVYEVKDSFQTDDKARLLRLEDAEPVLPAVAYLPSISVTRPPHCDAVCFCSLQSKLTSWTSGGTLVVGRSRLSTRYLPARTGA
jgi:serine/threonine protein kinase